MGCRAVVLRALAIIYGNRGDPTAVDAILERFANAPHGTGGAPAKLLERLEKVRRLA